MRPQYRIHTFMLTQRGELPFKRCRNVLVSNASNRFVLFAEDSVARKPTKLPAEYMYDIIPM